MDSKQFHRRVWVMVLLLVLMVPFSDFLLQAEAAMLASLRDLLALMG